MIEKIKGITRGQAIILGFFLLAGLVTFITLKINSANKISSYKKFQNELVDAAKNYKVIKNINVKMDMEKIISLSKLKKQNLVTNPLKDKCKGYVLISNEEVADDKYELVYRAYIKCGSKYKTDAYVEY